MPTKLAAQEARQGKTPHVVRYVLIVSLVLAVVALAVVAVVIAP
jgi:hypothetical protein